MLAFSASTSGPLLLLCTLWLLKVVRPPFLGICVITLDHVLERGDGSLSKQYQQPPIRGTENFVRNFSHLSLSFPIVVPKKLKHSNKRNSISVFSCAPTQWAQLDLRTFSPLQPHIHIHIHNKHSPLLFNREGGCVCVCV